MTINRHPAGSPIGGRFATHARPETDVHLVSNRARDPYVGSGIDGCLRSAEIDREEIDGLPTPSQPGWSAVVAQRRAELVASAEAWMDQARALADAADEASPGLGEELGRR